ncbi:hypothetical protein BGZ63DRAFT_457040 [Mariannaea sp. PMI_226]|nr:hypothetical protein BGZ63DRAFT_457040 [Mariannaea sp. PMI_226]
MKSTAGFLIFAISAVASPTPSIAKRDALDSKQSLCQGWDLTTPEGVDALWDQTSAGISLDLTIVSSSDGQNSWVKHMETLVQGGTASGKSSVDGCSLLADDCDPLGGMTCEDQYDKYGTNALGKDSYWIFQAVKGMHGKFNVLHSKLSDSALISGLNIGQMVSDFQGSEANTGDVLSWLSAASAMGGAFGGLALGPGVGAGLGFLSGLFSGLASAKGDNGGIDQGSISSALAGTFAKAVETLENTLRIATGHGQNDDEYNSLPAPKWDTYQSKIAKFFNGGWFLIDDDTAAVTAAFDSISYNIKVKVANDVLKAARMVLVADKNVDSREKCGSTGRQWLALRDGEEYCFYLMRADDNWTILQWTEPETEFYDNMAKYGLGNREPYYKAIIDCALNGGGSDHVKLDHLVWGQVPTCFLNLGAYFILTDDAFATCGDTTDSGLADLSNGNHSQMGQTMEGSLVTSSLSGLDATFRFVEIGIQMQGIAVDAQTLVRLVQQIEDDLEHAVACRVEAAQLLRRYPEHYRKWIVDCIRRTITVLDEFGQFILQDTDSKLSSFAQRVGYLLRTYPKLAEREKALTAVHPTLLAAINTMHLMLIPSGTLTDGQPSTSVARASLAPVISSPGLCRASSQRPISPRPESMLATAPPLPPQELPCREAPNIWAAELEGQSVENAQKVLHTLQRLREEHPAKQISHFD